ncbi:MAG: MarR family transcriptional regulator [Cytophagaceae bacterium]|nr:MarR family transcriptional regulator [Cytophagaceae bacterium]
MRKIEKLSVTKITEEPVSSVLWQVSSEWQRGVKRALDSIDITPSQSMILSSLLFLSKQRESVTQIDLSLHSKIDPMTTSSIIRTLERKELVRRKEHSTDTRAKIVVFTSYGSKTAKQAVKIIEKFDDQFFEALGNRSKTFQSSLAILLKTRG